MSYLKGHNLKHQSGKTYYKSIFNRTRILCYVCWNFFVFNRRGTYNVPGGPAVINESNSNGFGSANLSRFDKDKNGERGRGRGGGGGEGGGGRKGGRNLETLLSSCTWLHCLVRLTCSQFVSIPGHLYFLRILCPFTEGSPPVGDYRFSVGQLPSWAKKQVRTRLFIFI